jgi:serine/threonine-protein kinase
LVRDTTARERGCLDDDERTRLYRGALGPEATVVARRHVETCAECRAGVAALARRATRGRRFSAGEVVADKYRIERCIGAGGMGRVYRAHHLELDCPVALKFMRPDALEDADLVERFSREARAAARLKSEHSTRIYDVAKLPTGEPYIVMEYLEGRDMGRLLKERKTLPIEEAADYVLQACEAIGEAHACGIVHRDLKPQNLFVTQGPRGRPLVKVLDFGLAKLDVPSHFTARSGVTRTGMLLGSPNYMSPEQLENAREADARTDIWALGACLYEMLAGQPAFSAPTFPILSALVLTQDPKPLGELRPDVPEGLAGVVHRCLSKSPDARFATLDELALELMPFGSAVRSPRTASSAPPPPAEPPGRWPLVPILLAAGALVATIAGVVALTRTHHDEPAQKGGIETAAPTPASVAAPLPAPLPPASVPGDQAGTPQAATPEPEPTRPAAKPRAPARAPRERDPYDRR